MSAWASNKNVGTSGAAFLKVGVGARPAAMGESFVAVADDVNAVYYNPAGLAQLEKPELTAMHSQWFEGLSHDFAAFSLPTALGAWGVSAITLKTDDMDRRGEDEGALGSFNTLDAAYGISYAKQVREKILIGGTARYIQQKIDGTSAGAWGGDLGVLYRFEGRPLQLGMAIKNMGPGIKFQQESDPQPLVVDTGVYGKILRDRLGLALNIKKPRDNDVLFGLGTEWNQRLAADAGFALRAGYNSTYTDPGGAHGFSFGAGFSVKQFYIDAAWLPLGDLGNTFRYSATLKF